VELIEINGNLDEELEEFEGAFERYEKHCCNFFSF
jgi:hypothetical protein